MAKQEIRINCVDLKNVTLSKHGKPMPLTRLVFYFNFAYETRINCVDPLIGILGEHRKPTPLPRLVF